MSDINTFIDKFVTEVHETEEEFIFRTLSDFAAREYQIIVEKDELCKAIQLIRMRREYGQDIGEEYDTATRNVMWTNYAYNKGLKDGIKKEHDRIMDILNNRK